MKNRSHRLPTISDTPDDWVDESWTVDCVCGVNFDDGEEMVNCDECGVWVHTRCSQYVKSEELFACDKCKSKKFTHESEETEVAQLLVELPTKTLRMENSYPPSYPLQNQLQVWNEIPLEEKVHVQGIPGGDPALFGGLSSVFSPQLWKSTGYVPKKFNYQYREFPCWDERQEDGNRGKEDIENHACKGADTLFSLSKEDVLPASAAMKGQVDGGAAIDMGLLPSNEMKKKDAGSYESERQHSGVEKERSLMKPIVIHSGKRKKDDSRAFKDLSRKNKAKVVDKEDHKKGDVDSSEPVFTSNDAKQPESQEAKGPKVVQTDMQSVKHGNSSTDVHVVPKSHICHDVDNNVGKTINNRSFCGQPLEDLPSDFVRRNPPKDAKSVKENEGYQAPIRVEKFPLTKDVGLSVEHKDMLPMKDEARHHYMTDNRKSQSRSNAIQPQLDDGKSQRFQDSKGEVLANSLQSIEVKAVEVSHPGDTSNSKNFDLKLDSSNSLAQDTDMSISVEVKDDAISESQDKKVQNIDKSTLVIIHQAEEPDESHRSESLIVARRSSSERKHAPSGAHNQRKTIVSAIGKPSSSSSSIGLSKPSVHDKSRYYNTENRNSSASLNNKLMNKKDNASSEVSWDGDANGRPRKIAKDLQKSSSTSALKSSHFSKSSSHAPVPKKKCDSKDAVIPSSSSLQKTSGTPDSGDSGSSLQGESGALVQNKSSFPAPKNHHPPSVHPPASSNSPATLSDEELALLLHQELNSSPRVPRVPRMRHAGSLPQLATPTPTSMLMKRTSSSGGKDNIMVSRKKDKEVAKDGPSNSHELDDGAKKVERVPHLTNSRRHELVGNGSARVVLSVDKIVPTASTTVSSDPSSSTEANEQNVSSDRDLPRDASDDDTGAIGHTTHRTLPVLIAEIMSKGKRMTYEELCNAVLPHWPNLRKHNGERYAYSSHSHAVLDCLRNRSEWSRMVDRGPKTNASRKRRKHETESEENEDGNMKKMESSKSLESEFPKGKRKARKRRRLALQGRGIKDVRRRQKVEVPNDDIIVNSSSSSSEESIFSDEEIQGGTSASSDEMTGAIS